MLVLDDGALPPDVQARFVDDPREAVTEADRLVGEVMAARGYPVGDFEQRSAVVEIRSR